MLHKIIPLREGSTATLTTYIHDQSSQGEFQIQSRPGIIGMPGEPIPSSPTRRPSRWP